MNNSDYFSRLDRLDGLDTRGPEPRYRAAIDITGEPVKVTIPTWPKIDPLMWAPPAILLVLAVAVLITDLVVRW